MFPMRLNYSKARFVTAFPFQKQEAFFGGHLQGFHLLGGEPRQITYDNLKTTLYRILEGKKRQEQRAFTGFRGYYLFESHYCTPAQAHEKGGVDNSIGYAERNSFSPIPDVADFAELNEFLHQACLQDAQRRTRGQSQLVAKLWDPEKVLLLPLLPQDFRACTTKVVKPNRYLQVDYDTNRYTVPYEYRDKQLVLQALTYRIELLYLDQVIASHPRCFGKEQDILDPLHYLPLLVQRPGAFENAIPLNGWDGTWQDIEW